MRRVGGSVGPQESSAPPALGLSGPPALRPSDRGHTATRTPSSSRLALVDPLIRSHEAAVDVVLQVPRPPGVGRQAAPAREGTAVGRVEQGEERALRPIAYR